MESRFRLVWYLIRDLITLNKKNGELKIVAFNFQLSIFNLSYHSMFLRIRNSIGNKLFNLPGTAFTQPKFNPWYRTT